MEPEDLLTLTVRMLDQLDLNYGVADDGTTIVLATEDDEALFIGTGTITESTDHVWPVLWLNLPLLTDVETTPGIGPLDIAAINQDLFIGKVSFTDGTLSLQHEFVGWPGGAEYRVAIEALVGQVDEVRTALSNVKGSKPAPYSDLVGL